MQAIQLELQLFSPELASKPQILCYNKTDIPEATDAWDIIKSQILVKGIPETDLIAMSAVTGDNTEKVVRAARRILKELPEVEESETTAMNLQKPLRASSGAKIEDYGIDVYKDVTPHLYVVRGEAIELFTAMTNWTYYEAFRRFQRVLDRSGVSDALKERGVKNGDDVQIGERVFVWSDDNSEQEIYKSFKVTQKTERRASKGSTRWPHGKWQS